MIENINVVKKKKKNESNSTDFSLLVESISQNEIIKYDESKITESIMNEIGLDEVKAKKIAKSVTNKILKIEMETITTSLIRSFVNVELYQKGIGKELKSDNEFVMSYQDLENVITDPNNENGNTTHNPESINLTLAERIMKEYSLKKVFSKEIAEAHLRSDIAIHDLGFLTRYYCSGHSIEYIKKHGIRNVPNIASDSAPAKDAWVLARHICSATQFFTSLFAGAIGWEGVNIFIAPLLEGWDSKKLKQLAQTLIFDLSQLAGAKGGQVSFTDFNTYIDIPDHYKDTYAIGKSGKFMTKDSYGNIVYHNTREDADTHSSITGDAILRYKDFEKESKAFLNAILEVIGEGDSNGFPFAFPKINMHVNENSFTSEESVKVLKNACDASSKKGCPYFIFDRNAFSVSQCCRLNIQFDDEDIKATSTPEELRFVGIQNVSINLPNIPLQTSDDDEFYEELKRRMDLAVDAHIIKRDYVDKLSLKKNSPLKFYREGMDGKPYVDSSKGTYLIGIVGLNECVFNLIGQELHEDIKAFERGMEIILFMNEYKNELAKKYNIKIALEESPAESTANRLAKVDRKNFGEKAFVKENEFGVYYTNSVHFAIDSDVDYIDRIIDQSKYHPFVDAGSMIHTWGGEHEPSPEAIFNLVSKIWYETQTAQWVLSPEYTKCSDCCKTVTGIHKLCPNCGSEKTTSMSRVTGYYTLIENWNSGKKAELVHRKREEIL